VCLCCNLNHIPSCISLRVELLDYMAVLFLDFWGVSIWFSIVVGLIYILTNSLWKFLFPHILTFVVFYVLTSIQTIIGKHNFPFCLKCVESLFCPLMDLFSSRTFPLDFWLLSCSPCQNPKLRVLRLSYNWICYFYCQCH
jgi:hypothetical protein